MISVKELVESILAVITLCQVLSVLNYNLPDSDHRFIYFCETYGIPPGLVEIATLDWVDWSNHRRSLEPIGDIPPAEFELMYDR